ncbi:hypothetical protein Skr01_07440 [Sphaerisporangium krabiense]|uniref:Uncharacterized protein n=1 Tax=Sphaerisporangium krabiense TaxID=763782 RepID=A0A7W9DV33_9ACTN|nr:hypothetical protein [Sphaerisporangium krabiense]MBB5631704.1 hypothetical protein [Sphaerisporangium krabiense]GII60659.1 hypothetical protein Skr01_07440 [Sphaerisporangium krabiense]
MATPPPSRHADIADRVPGALSDLRGPATGEVAPPLHLCWSGLRVFDVADPAVRLALYQIVITEGLRADAEAYLEARLLEESWPRLRRLLNGAARAAWESRFPRLAEAARLREDEVRAELLRARAAVRARVAP